MGNDMRKVLKALEQQGFTVTRLSNGHYEVRLNGRRVATLAGNPGDRRAFRNALSYLRKAGFVWPPRS